MSGTENTPCSPTVRHVVVIHDIAHDIAIEHYRRDIDGS
jgi:hypothetical protein